jgi:hypothetical protein
MKKLLLVLFLLPGCLSYNKVFQDPSEYIWDGNIPMEWDGKYPIQTWRATIKVNEPFTGINGFQYILIKYEDDPNNEWYILEVNINKNAYWEN